MGKKGNSCIENAYKHVTIMPESSQNPVTFNTDIPVHSAKNVTKLPLEDDKCVVCVDSCRSGVRNFGVRKGWDRQHLMQKRTERARRVLRRTRNQLNKDF